MRECDQSNSAPNQTPFRPLDKYHWYSPEKTVTTQLAAVQGMFPKQTPGIDSVVLSVVQNETHYPMHPRTSVRWSLCVPRNGSFQTIRFEMQRQLKYPLLPQ